MPVTAAPEVDVVDRAARAFVDASRHANAPIVLAVSGGCDSMVLMYAVARACQQADGRTGHTRARVLTFDHGTGPAASAAAGLVEREAAALGLDVQVGRESLASASEAEWRAARWRFFRESAPGAKVATAHTRDDQLETVVMRAMRGAGARGLAGLACEPAHVTRPFLALARASLRTYGNARSVPFVEDPSNTSRRYLRNRVRLDLLPAIGRVRPRFAAEMLAVAELAAAWRADVDAFARELVSKGADDGIIRVARGDLATYDSATLCVLWPAIAARASVTLDRRGTLGLAQFTSSGAPGARIQLSGASRFFGIATSLSSVARHRRGLPGQWRWMGWSGSVIGASAQSRRSMVASRVRTYGFPIYPPTGVCRSGLGVPPTECDRECVGRHVV